jgi:hypothetical protein
MLLHQVQEHGTVAWLPVHVCQVLANCSHRQTVSKEGQVANLKHAAEPGLRTWNHCQAVKTHPPTVPICINQKGTHAGGPRKQT